MPSKGSAVINLVLEDRVPEAVVPVARSSARLKIFLGSAVWRTLEVSHEMCMRKLLIEATKRDDLQIYDETQVGDALISRARSITASRFLKSGYDVMLSIDSDIWFPTEDAFRICEMVGSGKYDIMGALYMVRSLHRPQPAQLFGDKKQLMFQPGEEPVPVRYLATGFMAVSRKVFEKLAETLPLCHKGEYWEFWPFFMPFTWPDERFENIYLSEDYAFCQRARDAGFEVWLDPTIRLGHQGDYQYRLENMIQTELSPQPIMFSQRPDGTMEVTGYAIEGEGDGVRDSSGLLEDLSAFWQVGVTTTLDRIKASKAQELLAAAWREQDPKTPRDIERFYSRNGKLYIEDLASLNIMVEYWVDAADLLVTKQKVIDFGGGIGSLAILLKDMGNLVTMVELPGEHRDFAKWRFERRQLDIPVKDSLDDLRDFDCLISTDVIEHIHPDAYPQLAKKIAGVLKPDGVARIRARWTPGAEENWPMHFVAEKEWEAAMREAGFIGGPIEWRKN